MRSSSRSRRSSAHRDAEARAAGGPPSGRRSLAASPARCSPPRSCAGADPRRADDGLCWRADAESLLTGDPRRACHAGGLQRRRAGPAWNACRPSLPGLDPVRRAGRSRRCRRRPLRLVGHRVRRPLRRHRCRRSPAGREERAPGGSRRPAPPHARRDARRRAVSRGGRPAAGRAPAGGVPPHGSAVRRQPLPRHRGGGRTPAGRRARTGAPHRGGRGLHQLRLRQRGHEARLPVLGRYGEPLRKLRRSARAQPRRGALDRCLVRPRRGQELRRRAGRYHGTTATSARCRSRPRADGRRTSRTTR